MGKTVFTARISSQPGFTLVEVMIALFISLFIFMSLYSVYTSQNKAYNNQQGLAEMQQNIRAASNIIIRDLRMAGLDPQGTAGAGFVDSSSANATWEGGTAVDTNSTQIAFLADLDNDGAINSSASSMSDVEKISYRLSGTELQRYCNTTGCGASHWQTVAENIQDLSFQYLDEDDNVTTNLKKIRTVVVSILAFSGKTGDAQLAKTFTNAAGTTINTNDRLLRRFTSNSVYCRNMGIE